MSIEIKPNEIISALQKQMEDFETKVEAQEIGTVIQVGDGIAQISGLETAMMGELIEIEGDEVVKALVLNLQADSVGVAILGEARFVKEGNIARLTKQIASVPVGDTILGRVINGFGEAIDGGEKLDQRKVRQVELKAPGIVSRQSVCEPLETGIKSIDTMIPIGRGQRELIIGDRKTGKTAIAIDTILNQKGKDVKCIYVAIGQKQSTVAQVYQKLKEADALSYTCIIAATASDSAALQYLAPYVGATMGEHFMYSGQHALIVYDDLTKQAQAYRQISLLLRRPPGREAFPGDVFYIHSRLLERAAKLSEKEGGGSLTALPIIETQAGDVSAYIPTNVISITDGQIFLDSNLFNSGQRPAVDVGLSVSRVGGDAQIKATKQVAGSLRLTLAQYRELAAFSQFASDLDASTQNQLIQGERMTLLLRQGQYKPYCIAKTIVMIYAGSKGFIDKIPVQKTMEFELEFSEYLDRSASKVLEQIESEQKLSDELNEKIEAIIKDFLKTTTLV